MRCSASVPMSVIDGVMMSPPEVDIVLIVVVVVPVASTIEIVCNTGTRGFA
jgi:hypothetical protein